MSRSRERLPGGWKAIILGIYAGIQRDLGPKASGETVMRSELRARLEELNIMIRTRQHREYWGIQFPALLIRTKELLEIEMPWATWWRETLSAYAPDLRKQMIG
jgi:hypothetical protein